MGKVHIKEKGITIITLVITIIILLILAGISITALVGNEGLINKTKKAKSDYENAQEEELAMLDEYGNFIDDEKTNDIDSLDTSNKKVLEEISNLKEKMENLEKNTLSLDTIYPVGSVYISTDLSTAELVNQKFGGTWEKYGQGRTLIGEGTGNDGAINKEFSVNSTGGEYNHVLSIAEMPSHNHESVKGEYSEAFSDVGLGSFMEAFNWINKRFIEIY